MRLAPALRGAFAALLISTVPTFAGEAVLFSGASGNAKGKEDRGTVTWSTTDDSQGVAFSAVVMIGDQTKAAVVIHKNTDTGLSATHLFDIALSKELGVIAIPGILARQQLDGTGVPLIGAAVSLGDGQRFLYALSDRPSDASRNTVQLETARYLDIPLVLADGRSAQLSLEISADDRVTLDGALTVWGMSP